MLDKPAAADKPKREPSAYQIFCKERMKKWNEENPGRAKEAMTQVGPSLYSSCHSLDWYSFVRAQQIALLWKDAPENPNRGQESKPRKPKAAKEPKEPKAKAKPRAKKAKKVEVEDEDEDADNSDPSIGDDEWLHMLASPRFIHSRIYSFIYFPYDSVISLLYPLRGALRGPHVYLSSSTSCGDYLFLLTNLFFLYSGCHA